MHNATTQNSTKYKHKHTRTRSSAPAFVRAIAWLVGARAAERYKKSAGIARRSRAFVALALRRALCDEAAMVSSQALLWVPYFIAVLMLESCSYVVRAQQSEYLLVPILMGCLDTQR